MCKQICGTSLTHFDNVPWLSSGSGRIPHAFLEVLWFVAFQDAHFLLVCQPRGVFFLILQFFVIPFTHFVSKPQCSSLFVLVFFSHLVVWTDFPAVDCVRVAKVCLCGFALCRFQSVEKRCQLRCLRLGLDEDLETDFALAREDRRVVAQVRQVESRDGGC